ncbi:MAG TPA: hypothetical protein VF136_11845 [Methylomirabilota bacterium]
MRGSSAWLARSSRKAGCSRRYHGEGGNPGRALVTRVEQTEIAERDFTPPAGFRAAPLAELFGRR